MSTLSLSPRFDLFRFALPDDFLPDPVVEKWKKFLNKEPGVLISPIDYLNESIKGITFPGVNDINITQNQHSTNPIVRTNKTPGARSLGRINIEPNQNNTYIGPQNPLDRINRELQVTFRLNQGLYNYFMLYEALFYRMCKHEDYKDGDTFYIKLLNEEYVATSEIILSQVHMNGIEGLDFSFDKTERSSDTFNVSFAFNNVDYEFLDIEEVE